MSDFDQSLSRLTPTGELLANAGKQAYKDTGKDNKRPLESVTGGQNLDFKPLKRETREKRLQVLVTPATLKALDRLAKKSKTSRNDVINQILENYLERN